ncbi:tbc1 domain family member gtpase-activating protein [Anaeramoeba flamelloides]|uniref:Tbc1 domain family member gtpase-activating protein n=1 Tax=Anaeramoeba flamelloides TaxID=1746091 RepID=A0AAV7Y958_9EUKA|nr:tbc1 domain family member gtpase-activating protein [Anaeramoeba flamelloides]
MEEFHRSISLPFSFRKLKKEVQQGKYHQTQIRSIIWRICLGCFSQEPNPKEFCDLIHKHRERYSLLKKKYIRTFKVAGNKKKNNNSSDNKKENTMRIKNQNKDYDFSNLILLDVKRTNAGEELFKKNETKKLLFNILFIYQKQHLDLGYKQGMNDLLANIFVVVYNEYITNENNDCYSILMDNNYIEEDCYLIFEHLMEKFRNVFLSVKQDNNKKNKKRNKKKIDKSKEDNQTKTTNFNTEGIIISPPLIIKSQNKAKTKINKKRKIPKIVKYCIKMQNVYLKRFDEELYRNFQLLKLEPQLYCFRWFRLLLSREFSINKILILWDYIFSDPNPIEFVSYFIVSMLILIRDQLFGDSTKVYKKLFLYSYDGKFDDIINITKNIRKPDEKTNKMIMKIKKRKPSPMYKHVIKSNRQPRAVNLRKNQPNPRSRKNLPNNEKIKIINKNQIKRYFLEKQNQKKKNKLLNEKKLILQQILSKVEDQMIPIDFIENPIQNIQEIIFNNLYHSQEIQKKLYRPLGDLKNVLLKQSSTSNLKDINEYNQKFNLNNNNHSSRGDIGSKNNIVDKHKTRDENLSNLKDINVKGIFKNEKTETFIEFSNVLCNKETIPRDNILINNTQIPNIFIKSDNQNKKNIMDDWSIIIYSFTHNAYSNRKRKIHITEDTQFDLFTKTNFKKNYLNNFNNSQSNSFFVSNKHIPCVLNFKYIAENNPILI